MAVPQPRLGTGCTAPAGPGLVGFAPVQLMKSSLLVQLESRGIHDPQERIPSLYAVVMCVRQMFFPVQKGGICLNLVCRTVRAHMDPALSPFVHILGVPPHVLSLHSTPALRAWHFLPQVTSSSGHPSGFKVGWLSGWQFVRIARLN